MRGSVKEILGTCVSVGCTVDHKNPRDVQTAIDEGEYDIPDEWCRCCWGSFCCCCPTCQLCSWWIWCWNGRHKVRALMCGWVEVNVAENICLVALWVRVEFANQIARFWQLSRILPCKHLYFCLLIGTWCNLASCAHLFSSLFGEVMVVRAKALKRQVFDHCQCYEIKKAGMFFRSGA